MSVFKKFPSFDELVRGASGTFKRFPAAILCALLLTIVMVCLVDKEGTPPEGILIRIAIVSALGISLQIALTTWSEKRESGSFLNYIIQFAGLVLLLLYYWSLPSNPTIAAVYMIRSLILGILLHALVSFIPYLSAGQVTGFWQYNKSLFLRILFSALYSVVLYVGLAIALLAAKELFGMDIPGKRFFQLWIIIVATFNTWLFLAGIPKDLKALNETESYPKGLKVFAQYILLPLVGLYLIILYAYELKIIINWKWPIGWVSQLVLWYSVVGILSMLLLWPLREIIENRWIRNYTKWFFRALIPLIVMLFLAITERISDYGITVNRYLVIALATGLALVTLYFVISRKKDIRVIPIILCIIALISAYGPWGAFAVGERSQQGRLEKLLIANNLYIDGKISSVNVELDIEQVKELSSIVSYLAEYHGARAFSRWLPESSLTPLDTLENHWSVNDSISNMLGFKYTSRWEERLDMFAYDLLDSAAINIENYQHMIRFQEYISESLSSKVFYQIGQDTLSIWLKKKPAALYIEIKPPRNDYAIPFQYDLNPLLTSLADSRRDSLNGVIITPEISIDDYDLKIVTKHFDGNRIQDTVEVYNYTSYILLRKK